MVIDRTIEIDQGMVALVVLSTCRLFYRLHRHKTDPRHNLRSLHKDHDHRTAYQNYLQPKSLQNISMPTLFAGLNYVRGHRGYLIQNDGICRPAEILSPRLVIIKRQTWHQEVILLRLVPGGQGVQGAAGRGVHNSCCEIPPWQGEGAGAHQSDLTTQQQRTQDNSERFFWEESARQLQGRDIIKN